MSIVRWFPTGQSLIDSSIIDIGGESGLCLMFCAWQFPSGQISLVRCSGRMSKVRPMLPVEVFT